MDNDSRPYSRNNTKYHLQIISVEFLCIIVWYGVIRLYMMTKPPIYYSPYSIVVVISPLILMIVVSFIATCLSRRIVEWNAATLISIPPPLFYSFIVFLELYIRNAEYFTAEAIPFFVLIFTPFMLLIIMLNALAIWGGSKISIVFSQKGK